MPVERRTTNHPLSYAEDDDVEEGEPQHQQQRRRRRRRRKHPRRGGGRALALPEPQLNDAVDGQNQQDSPTDVHQETLQEHPQEDSDDSDSGTDPEAFDEYIAVSRSELRNNDFDERSFFAELFGAHKDVECPICLGILKRTRMVMGCMHRFCKECIDKSMRLGNNECPACRMHCASRRSLRDDPAYDRFIEAVYPDVEKYEEEELVLQVEERMRNEQIQASIAQISQRQAQALVKRRRSRKYTTFMSEESHDYQNAQISEERNTQRTELQEAGENEDGINHNGNKSLTPTDNHGTEVKLSTCRRSRVTAPQSSPTAVNLDGRCAVNMTNPIQEEKGDLPGFLRNQETLTWGRGAARSHTRHGSVSGSRSSRSTRLARLTDSLERAQEIEDELNVHLMLISLDNQRIPNLKQPHLCCDPSLSIKHLREHVAPEIASQAENVRMLSVKNTDSSCVELQILDDRETVAGYKANCLSSKGQLILAYGDKKIL